MKKTLVSALTAAFALGATATTFAAANPFEDVPADHWAYDAVAQLAADGVIEGYGDGTYRGDQEITRYEMAQMIARAMTKGATGADKSLVDKLAAEFADELNNLGVRVSALEKKVDNVKWGGNVRYRYNRTVVEKRAKDPAHQNALLFRLEPTATINKHWVAKARIDYNKADEMKSAQNYTSVSVDRAWVQGTYGSTVIQLGRFFNASAADYGMVLGERMSGGKVVFGNDIKISIGATRLNLANSAAQPLFRHGQSGPNYAANEGTTSYQGIEIFSNRKNKFTWGIGYHHVENSSVFKGNYGDKDIGIVNVGLGYKLSDTIGLTAAYAHSDADKIKGYKGGVRDLKGDKLKQSYAFQIDYKGGNNANRNKPGDFGLYAAFRHLGDLSTISTNYKELGPQVGGTQGWVVGGSVTFDKNILGRVAYFNGEDIASGKEHNTIWTELNFFF